MLHEAKIKTSQYDGVCLHKKTGKWQVEFIVNSRKQYGGIFYNELNAAKRVNQLCEELKIPHRNHGIGAIPNEVTNKFFFLMESEKALHVRSGVFFYGFQ